MSRILLSDILTHIILKQCKDISVHYSIPNSDEGCLVGSYIDTRHVLISSLLDTSFLEYCVKQSRSEAEMLLIENLGVFDPDHKFIDKFLNYKDMLPEDVLEIAFQSRNDHGAPGFGTRDMSSDNGGVRESEQGNNNPVGPDESKGGGKKKGKKGKKVSPAVLGFNVVSNRIMMGEIQTVEE